jgi:hypothetical protein
MPPFMAAFFKGYTASMRIEGKTALITGGASGLGAT